MTDREMVLHLMKKIGREIIADRATYIEVDYPSGEDVVFEFDEDENLTDMY
jgi:hypothetical protein